jgi:hypothetical protein
MKFKHCNRKQLKNRYLTKSFELYAYVLALDMSSRCYPIIFPIAHTTPKLKILWICHQDTNNERHMQKNQKMMKYETKNKIETKQNKTKQK